jgi:hypothetical protein
MNPDPNGLTVVPGEEVLRRPARGLLGWLSDQEAVAALLGRNPVPGEDISSQLGVATGCRSSVAARSIYRPANPVLRREFSGLDDIRSRQDVVSNLGPLNWRPAVVDLRRVLSFQKVIHIDGLEERLGDLSDEKSLLELCIPTDQPAPPTGAFTDQDGKGFTVSSFNPNLRIAAGQISDAQVSQGPGLSPVKMQAITLLVFMGPSFLQVVRYKERSFIRDGYHRAAGLVRRGVFEVPCIFIEARSFDEVGDVRGAFSYEVLYGDRPPGLVDFWDDAVSRAIEQPAVRKVIRVRGEEFVVPR